MIRDPNMDLTFLANLILPPLDRHPQDQKIFLLKLHTR